MFKRVAAACVVVSAVAVPAPAQEKPFSFMAGGVLMAPLSNSADRFSMGLGFTGGVAWRFTSDLSLTADYPWSTLGVQEESATHSASMPAEVTPRIQFGTVNIKFQSAPGRARLHLLAGGGIYHRSVGLSASGSGNISVCDPWWFLCPPGPIPVSSFNGTQNGHEPGPQFRSGPDGGEVLRRGPLSLHVGSEVRDVEGHRGRQREVLSADRWRQLLTAGSVHDNGPGTTRAVVAHPPIRAGATSSSPPRTPAAALRSR